MRSPGPVAQRRYDCQRKPSLTSQTSMISINWIERGRTSAIYQRLSLYPKVNGEGWEGFFPFIEEVNFDNLDERPDLNYIVEIDYSKPNECVELAQKAFRINPQQGLLKPKSPFHKENIRKSNLCVWQNMTKYAQKKQKSDEPMKPIKSTETVKIKVSPRLNLDTSGKHDSIKVFTVKSPSKSSKDSTQIFSNLSIEDQVALRTPILSKRLPKLKMQKFKLRKSQVDNDILSDNILKGKEIELGSLKTDAIKTDPTKEVPKKKKKSPSSTRKIKVASKYDSKIITIDILSIYKSDSDSSNKTKTIKKFSPIMLKEDKSSSDSKTIHKLPELDTKTKELILLDFKSNPTKDGKKQEKEQNKIDLFSPGNLRATRKFSNRSKSIQLTPQKSKSKSGKKAKKDNKEKSLKKVSTIEKFVFNILESSIKPVKDEETSKTTQDYFNKKDDAKTIKSKSPEFKVDSKVETIKKDFARKSEDGKNLTTSKAVLSKEDTEKVRKFKNLRSSEVVKKVKSEEVKVEIPNSLKIKKFKNASSSEQTLSPTKIPAPKVGSPKKPESPEKKITFLKEDSPKMKKFQNILFSEKMISPNKDSAPKDSTPKKPKSPEPKTIVPKSNSPKASKFQNKITEKSIEVKESVPKASSEKAELSSAKIVPKEDSPEMKRFKNASSSEQQAPVAKIPDLQKDKKLSETKISLSKEDLTKKEKIPETKAPDAKEDSSKIRKFKNSRNSTSEKKEPEEKVIQKESKTVTINNDSPKIKKFKNATSSERKVFGTDLVLAKEKSPEIKMPGLKESSPNKAKSPECKAHVPKEQKLETKAQKESPPKGEKFRNGMISVRKSPDPEMQGKKFTNKNTSEQITPPNDEKKKIAEGSKRKTNGKTKLPSANREEKSDSSPKKLIVAIPKTESLPKKKSLVVIPKLSEVDLPSQINFASVNVSLSILKSKKSSAKVSSPCVSLLNEDKFKTIKSPQKDSLGFDDKIKRVKSSFKSSSPKKPVEAISSVTVSNQGNQPVSAPASAASPILVPNSTSAQVIPPSPAQVTPSLSPTQVTPLSPPTQVTPLSPQTQVTPLSPPTQVTPLSPPTQVTPLSSPTQVTPLSSPTQVTHLLPPTQVTPLSPPTQATISPSTSVQTVQIISKESLPMGLEKFKPIKSSSQSKQDETLILETIKSDLVADQLKSTSSESSQCLKPLRDSLKTKVDKNFELILNTNTKFAVKPSNKDSVEIVKVKVYETSLPGLQRKHTTAEALRMYTSSKSVIEARRSLEIKRSTESLLKIPLEAKLKQGSEDSFYFQSMILKKKGQKKEPEEY